MIAKLQFKNRKFFVDFSKPLFSFCIKFSTAAYKIKVNNFSQLLLLWIELTAFVINRFDALEKLLIQHDVVAVLRQFRGHFLSQLLHRVVCIGFAQVVKNRTYACQHFATGIKFRQRVVKRSFVLIIYNGVNLEFLQTHSFFESRFVMFEFDLVEGRNAKLSIKF
ncbi:hypothetical protein SDC9_67778 [bioreactor metagenome]|uniref:Uncharacterized protein n=1 Tax=bioreactor metagenome TaxID=1076179 RepID=A0A644Y568_9ZZZZ